MLVLIYSLLLFSTAFIFHVVLWKIRLPKRQTKVLLQVFFGTLIIGILFLSSISSFTSAVDDFTPQKTLEYIHVCLLFVSLTLSYMITYSAFEADSPTLVMVMTIEKAGQGGLDKKEFIQRLNDDILIKPRIRDLITDKMAYLDGEKYRLTSKGVLFARIFILYRRLLKAPKGG